MKKTTYDALTDWGRKNPLGHKALIATNKYLTLAIYILYPITLFLLFIQGRNEWKRFLLVPMITFLFVSLLRKVSNAPRPYEMMAIRPLIVREKKGQSFPSRHVASSMIIAMACYTVNLQFGLLVTIITFLIGIIRVLGGVHFAKDVLAGILISFLFGIVGFWMI